VFCSKHIDKVNQSLTTSADI